MPGTDAKDAVVASYEALNESDIDAAMEALAEDAEWHESEVLPDTGVYRGREAIRAFLTAVPRLLGALPPDRRGGPAGGRPRAGDDPPGGDGPRLGRDVDARYAHLWTVSGGRGIRVDAFYDRDEALAALNP